MHDKNYSWVWPIVLIILHSVCEEREREGVGGVVVTIVVYITKLLGVRVIN